MTMTLDNTNRNTTKIPKEKKLFRNFLCKYFNNYNVIKFVQYIAHILIINLLC